MFLTHKLTFFSSNFLYVKPLDPVLAHAQVGYEDISHCQCFCFFSPATALLVLLELCNGILSILL